MKKKKKTLYVSLSLSLSRLHVSELLNLQTYHQICVSTKATRWTSSFSAIALSSLPPAYHGPTWTSIIFVVWDRRQLCYPYVNPCFDLLSRRLRIDLERRLFQKLEPRTSPPSFSFYGKARLSLSFFVGPEDRRRPTIWLTKRTEQLLFFDPTTQGYQTNELGFPQRRSFLFAENPLLSSSFFFAKNPQQPMFVARVHLSTSSTSVVVILIDMHTVVVQ